MKWLPLTSFLALAACGVDFDQLLNPKNVSTAAAAANAEGIDPVKLDPGKVGLASIACQMLANSSESLAIEWCEVGAEIAK